MSIHRNSFSLNINSNAENLTNGNGSSFKIQMNKAIDLRNKKVRLRCLKGSVPFTFSNINAEKQNNTLYLKKGLTVYLLIFPNGIYSVIDINNFISDELLTLNIINSNFEAPYFSGVNSTGQLYLVLPQMTQAWSVDWTQSKISNILGFVLGGIDVGSTTETSYYLSDTRAALNEDISALYIHCNLINSTYVNGNLSDVLITVIPDVQSGSIINFSERWPIEHQIVTDYIESIDFYLTNAKNEMMNILGEYITLTLEFLIEN